MRARVSYPVEVKQKAGRNEIGGRACEGDHAGIEYKE